MNDDLENCENEKSCAMLGLWTANNYGSVLTAWSLYKMLVTLGYHPVLVDHIEARNKNTIVGRFIRSRCKVTKAFNTSAEMKELNEYINTFIVGSDQNWNEYWLEEIKGFTFFLDFVDDDKRKISYATSFGNDDYRGLVEELDVIKQYMKRFDAISLREDGAAKLWGNLLNRDVMCSIDPVFFTPRDEYQFLAREFLAKENKEYVLEFILDVSNKLIDNGRRVSEALGINFELFLGADFLPQDGIELEWDKEAHPVEEAIARVADAKYIITDSFHVMCLSLIFHKPFVCIANQRGIARINTVLKRLGMNLNSYLISLEDMEKIDWLKHFQNENFDWDNIDKAICMWRDASLDWLKNSMECELLSYKTDKNLLLMEALDLAALGNRNATNGLNRLDVIDRILKAMNDRFSIIDNILSEHLFEIRALKAPSVKVRGDKIEAFLDKMIPIEARIAIRGGGEHTRRLLELMKNIIVKKNLHIIYIIDLKTDLSFDFADSCEVITPKIFWEEKKPIDIVIISSARYSKEILEEISENNRYEYLILNPYDAFDSSEVFERVAWFD